MSLLNRIDLSQLPAPEAVQQLDYAEIRDAMLADVNSRARVLDADHSDFVPSDSAYLIIEAAAYRELLLRQQLNDQSTQLMLAYAAGANLDHIAATYYRVSRLVIQQADATKVPPTPEILEADDDFRQRIALSVEAWSNAGSAGAYAFHALSGNEPITGVSLVQESAGEVQVTYQFTANPDIAKVHSVGVSSVNAGEVRIAVLSRENNGVPEQAVLDAVTLAVNSTSVRPLTDRVIVQAAQIIDYQINAILRFYPGADKQVVMNAAQQAIDTYVTQSFRVGIDVTVSGRYAALHQPGVHSVDMGEVADIICDQTQAARCTAINLTDGGVDE